MLTEKDLLARIPEDLREALGAVLERYQRHLMRLEAELAEMRASLAGSNSHLRRPRLTAVRPASFRRPRLSQSIVKEEDKRTQPEYAIVWDQ
jgi:hypothetical protein